MDNTNDETRLIGERIREDSEEEEIFEDVNDNTIYEEELKTLIQILTITSHHQQ